MEERAEETEIGGKQVNPNAHCKVVEPLGVTTPIIVVKALV